MNNAVYHITFKRGEIRENIIRDAQNDDGWPSDALHQVTVDPGEITVEGTPAGIRWIYDWLNWAADAHRLEGSTWEADECDAMAEIIWEAAEGELPERQRPRRRI